MEMTYNGTLVMPANYAVVNEEEMTYVEGGGFFDAVKEFASGIGLTITSLSLLSGASATTVAGTAVTTALVATPGGLMVLGICVVGGVATGIMTVKAYHK